MAVTFGIRSNRVLPVLAVVAASIATPCAQANASPVFDVDGYSTCTATTMPAPDQDFDAVVTTCCVRNAGVPAPTRFGMGCVAPIDASADERPTIALPMRPPAPGDGGGAWDDLGDLPVADPVP